MKVFTGRLFAALILISPFLASVPARADYDSGTKTEQSYDRHEDVNDDGHNDDGGGDDSSDHGGGTESHGDESGQVSSGGSSGDSNDFFLKAKNRRRVAAFVAAPVLDTQQTRDAIDKGHAASMPLLTTYLNMNYPGQVLDVKLHDVSDGYVYEVRYLSNIVVLRTLFLDAVTLKAK